MNYSKLTLLALVISQGLFTNFINFNASAQSSEKPTVKVLSQLSDEVWRPGEEKAIVYSWNGATDNDRLLVLLAWEEPGVYPKNEEGQNYGGYTVSFGALHGNDIPHRTNVIRYVVPKGIPAGRHRIWVNLQNITQDSSQGSVWVGSAKIPEQGKIKQFFLAPPTLGKLGSAMIGAEGLPRVPYTLQESRDFLTWVSVSAPQGTPSGVFYFMTVLTNNVSPRFYRLIEVR